MINHLDVNSVKITFYSEKETIGGKRDSLMITTTELSKAIYHNDLLTGMYSKPCQTSKMKIFVN